MTNTNAYNLVTIIINAEQKFTMLSICKKKTK